MARLFVTKGKRLLAIHLIEGPLMIGRGRSSDVHVDDARASRIHAVITCENGRIFLRDLDSRNGTELNGEPVADLVEIKHGDMICVGDSRLYVGEPPISIKKRYLATEPPVCVGRYNIIQPLGKGGMGEVYKAFDTEDETIVALKVVRKALASSPEYVRRFHDREAQLVRKLCHPNIVEVYEDGVAGGHHYIAMEYVDGGSLADRMQDGPLPTAEAIEVIKQVASGLMAAHEQGIVHRDIKPQNILLAARKPEEHADRPEAPAADVEIAQGAGKPADVNLPEADLVGRSVELERLSAALNSARKGRENLFIVRGERGIGKTRLIRAFARMVQERGYQVFAAEHEPSPDGSPAIFNPFGRMAEELLEQAENRRDALPGHTFERWLEHLAPIVSDATRQSYGRRSHRTCNPHRAADALCDLWTVVQPEGKFVVILDDFHCADEVSCQMLEYMVRSAGAERFLVCCGLRDDGSRVNAPLQALLVGLMRAGLVAEMYLKPLTRHGTFKLAAGVLGRRGPAESIIEGLFRVSKGIPGTIRLALASLVDRKVLIETDDGYELSGRDSYQLDAELSQLLIDRYEAQPTPIREVFDICCLAERGFNFAVIQPVTRQDSVRLYFALNHLVSEGLLVVDERDGDRFYRVACEELCQRGESGLSARDRVRLHNALAASIDRAFSEPGPDVLERLAHHHLHGGNDARAVRSLVRAAEAAKRVDGSMAARPFLEAIIDVLRSTPQGTDRRQRREAGLKEMFGPMNDCIDYIRRLIGVLHADCVKIADFGVALTPIDAKDDDLNRTQGTPRYMAPEQILGKPLDGRSDIFSLGVVAFEMLTGRRTFEVEHKSQYFNLNCNEDIRPLTEVRPSIPDEVARIVQKMTARDRAARYTAAELIADIERAQMQIFAR